MKYFACVVFIVFFSVCMAVTHYVPGDYATIQAAIDASDNQDIVLISEGVYHENIDFHGKTITVSSLYYTDNNHEHIQNTVIDASGTGSVAVFTSNETQDAVLKGITLTGGNHILGGGISIRNASPTIMNCIIRNNSSTQAAGVFVSNSDAKLINLTICDNDGKGLKVIGTGGPVVSSCIIYHNSSEIVAHLNTSLSFCDLETPWEGTGNISTDPLLVDHAQHNYALMANSPCINAGSPYQPGEHDGTRADMGAVHYHNNEAELYADFYASETSVITSDPYQINFTSYIGAFNCSAGSIAWSFGDGDSSSLQNPSHSYIPGGYYDVSLTVTAGTLSYVASKAHYITMYNDVSASFPAVLDVSSSPYYVGSNQYVSHNVYISEGVEIFLADNLYLGFNEIVNAVGTQAAPITFKPFNPGAHAGDLGFYGNPTLDYCNFDRCNTVTFSPTQATATVSNCRFENMLWAGMEILAPTNISYCYISNCGASGIIIYYSGASISQTTVNTCAGNAVYLSDTGMVSPYYQVSITDSNLQNNNNTYPVVYVGYGYETTISGCDVNGGLRGIVNVAFAAVEVFDCNIHDTVNQGMWIEGICEADVYNNRVHHNRWGIYINSTDNNNVRIQGNLVYDNDEDGICVVNSSPLISNNSVVHNNQVAAANTAGIWFSFASNPIIVNNIIYDNLADIQSNEYTPGVVPVLSHNLIQYPLPQYVVDIGFNLVADPMFIPGSWYNLSAGSPAIDSGNMDPQYYSLLQNDIWGGVRVYDGDNNGSTLIDRGCNEYCPTPISDENIPSVAKFVLETYPNPMKGELNLQCHAKDSSKPYEVEIFNLRGQKLFQFSGMELKGEQHLRWDGKDKDGRNAASGIYIVRVKGSNFNVSRRITLMRD